jgi:hypothetical protein
MQNREYKKDQYPFLFYEEAYFANAMSKTYCPNDNS